jgi:hypothetical protein
MSTIFGSGPVITLLRPFLRIVSPIDSGVCARAGRRLWGFPPYTSRVPHERGRVRTAP